MAIIIKNYKNDKGITSNLYVKIDSLHNMGEAQNKQVVLNTTQWLDTNARTDSKIEQLYSNKVFIVKDRPIKATDNLINAGYQLLKEHLKEQGYTVEDDMNNYGEDMTQAEINNEFLEKQLAMEN